MAIAPGKPTIFFFLFIIVGLIVFLYWMRGRQLVEGGAKVGDYWAPPAPKSASEKAQEDMEANGIYTAPPPQTTSPTSANISPLLGRAPADFSTPLPVPMPHWKVSPAVPPPVPMPNWTVNPAVPQPVPMPVWKQTEKNKVVSF